MYTQLSFSFGMSKSERLIDHMVLTTSVWHSLSLSISGSQASPNSSPSVFFWSGLYTSTDVLKCTSIALGLKRQLHTWTVIADVANHVTSQAIVILVLLARVWHCRVRKKVRGGVYRLIRQSLTQRAVVLKEEG